MRIWVLSVILILLLIAINVYNRKDDTQPIVFVRNNSDSLYKVIDSLKQSESMLLSEITELNKNKEKIRIIYREKDNNICNLSANNSIILFGEWNRQLQDSSYQARYFRISSDTIY
jgi:uncharacterized protein YlxW (UPF0749 family)